jgi:predicted GNAT family acetyltransferase
LRLVASRTESADEDKFVQGLTAMSDSVRNNAAASRFELDADGHTAFAYYYYTMAGDVITFRHTEVPPALEGHGIGSRLIRGALEFARAEGLKVVPQCRSSPPIWRNTRSSTICCVSPERQSRASLRTDN